MKSIYLAFSPEELDRKGEAERLCHKEAQMRGFKDWWDWYGAEEQEAYKFCLQFK